MRAAPEPKVVGSSSTGRTNKPTTYRPRQDRRFGVPLKPNYWERGRTIWSPPIVAAALTTSERLDLPWYDGLEGAALEFARSVAGKLRALAGPGTAKTFALIRRLIARRGRGAGPAGAGDESSRAPSSSAGRFRPARGSCWQRSKRSSSCVLAERDRNAPPDHRDLQGVVHDEAREHRIGEDREHLRPG